MGAVLVKKPRDYQEWAHAATMQYIHDPANHTGAKANPMWPKCPLVVEATGLGKSLNIAMFIWDMLVKYPTLRIMQLCHVKELVHGNYMELLGMWPSAPAGVYAAGLNEKNDRAQVTFAMINSVAKRPATFGHVDFILVDEAHRLSPSDAAMYSKFIAALRVKNPKLIVVGYTATDYRAKGGLLTDMELFDDVVYNVGGGESFLWAVQQGYLIMPVPTDPGFNFDDSAIGISAGDFKDGEASAAMHEQDIIERAVDFSIKVASDENRRSAIAFAQSIEDSELIAEMFTYKGFPMEAVHSKRSDRDSILAAHKAGDLWGVSNKDILTTGWNNPLVDLFVGLRLTRSPGLWVQMVGRMTRPLWVNHIGHNGGPGVAPVRVCDVEKEAQNGHGCSPATLHHTSVPFCPHCGYEWPKTSNLRAVASGDELVTANNPLGLPAAPAKEFGVYGVHQMTAVHHQGKFKSDDDKHLPEDQRERKPDTCKVTYRSGYHSFSTWVCFAHPEGNFARRKAVDWWKSHGGHGPAPTDIEEAVEAVGGLSKPKFIRVWENTKFPEITEYDFVGTRFETFDMTNLSAEQKVFDVEPDPQEEILKAKAADDAKIDEIMGQTYYDDDIPF